MLTWQRQRDELLAAPVPDQVVMDFSAGSTSATWYSDGVAFGLGPTEVGTLRLGLTTKEPFDGIAAFSAARRDMAFSNLSFAPGTEGDAGLLSDWRRAGQTLRTRKITLKSGQLWYLVRGAGRAYAVVDSHLVIAGPLHHALLHQWKSEKNDRWTWVHQDLSEYPGQRCHVEFSPASGGLFEVAKVIEADRPPAIDLMNGVVLAAMNEAAIDSVESLAKAEQKVLASAADRLGAGDINGRPDALDWAALADFVVRHPNLLCETGELPPPFAPWPIILLPINPPWLRALSRNPPPRRRCSREAALTKTC